MKTKTMKTTDEDYNDDDDDLLDNVLSYTLPVFSGSHWYRVCLPIDDG